MTVRHRGRVLRCSAGRSPVRLRRPPRLPTCWPSAGPSTYQGRAPLAASARSRSAAVGGKVVQRELSNLCAATHEISGRGIRK